MEVREPSARYLVEAEPVTPAGYKQTEVGVIPEDWDCTSLGAISSISAGGTPSRRIPEYWGGDIPWVTTAEIDFNTVRSSAESISSLGLKNSAAKLFPAETLLMALYGQGKTRGKVATLGIAATTNQACASIVVVPSVSRAYIFHFLASRYERIRGLSNSGSQDNLSGQIVKSINVPLPPSKAEQQAIAEALSDADALIESLDQLLAKKHQIKQGAMQELLTGQKRLPGFSGEWRTRSFDGVLQRINAKAHQIPTADYQPIGACPIVDQGKVRVVAFSDQGERRFRCPEQGAIVFGDHTCIVKYVDFDFLVGADGTQVLVAKEGECTRFHAFQLEYDGIQPTGYNRHFSLLKEREFLVPTLPEQTAIATVLADMDAEIAALEARLAKARLLKQGMMQELLTGRIRLV